ncbi:GRIP1-associated protein 1-like [Exaiptasia diaphana]|uniref:Uncharacterized protein n=1 Tax=Exaiptasia diaphana TaxID=2652724 RepID=A0A913YMK6_EXADI|nr:GRIP1-associated protein 1-like [Exaiptasia diaphana]
MAQSLSAEEFGRIQEQIIELRTLNYELEAQNQRQDSEIKNLQDKLLSQEKELQKSQKIINKSKQKKEYSLLLEENESLQRQFQSQEENFKLQNQTLLLEITRLNEENDSLKKDFEKLHKTGSQENSSNDAEIIRLRAENVALQKSLASAQERYDQELEALQKNSKQATEEENVENKITELEIKDSSTEPLNITDGDSNSNNENDDVNNKLQYILNEELNELSIKIQSLQTKDVQVNGDIGSEDNTKETENHTIDVEIQSVKDRIVTAISPLLSADSKVNGNARISKESFQQSEAKVLSLERQVKEMSGLQLRLDTELEEKHLLQEQLLQREESSQKEIAQQKDDISKLTDKLKKKQERLLNMF